MPIPHKPTIHTQDQDLNWQRVAQAMLACSNRPIPFNKINKIIIVTYTNGDGIKILPNTVDHKSKLFRAALRDWTLDWWFMLLGRYSQV